MAGRLRTIQPESATLHYPIPNQRKSTMRLQTLLALATLTAALVGQQPEAKVPDRTNSWFTETKKRIDGAGEEKHVVAEYPFRNPQNHDVVWREFEASCACSHLEFVVGDRRFWMKPKPRELVELVAAEGDGEPTKVPVSSITIPANAEGTVEVHVDLHGKLPRRQISVNIHTDDDGAKMLRLSLDVSNGQPLVITPPEVHLGNIAPDEPVPFEVEVVAPGEKDFKIELQSPVPPMLQADYSARDVNDMRLWTIRGTFTSSVPGKAIGTMLKFKTSSKTHPSFDVRVYADVIQPIVITPAFAHLGAIRSTTGIKKSIRFHATNETDLQVVNLSFANLSGPAKGAQATSRKDGKDVIVDLVIPAGCGRGLLRGDLVVELNHQDSEQRLLFNGFVR
jgi:hypothetical protein